MIGCAGPVRRLEVLADAERAVGIDLPGERDPELAFLPHLAGIRLVGGVDLLAALLARDAQHRLAEPEPLRGVRLLAHRVVALGAETHRQDVVGEPRRLAPGRRQRDVQADLVLVGQHLHPREAVRIRPHRVVDAREVHVELAAVLLEEVRQQEAHLEERERKLPREEQLVPVVGRRRRGRMLRDELVREVQLDAALRADRAGQDDEQVEAAGDLPAPEVAGGRGAPAVRAEGARARGRSARAASTICAAATPVSPAANSGVNCAYCSFSARMKLSNVTARSGPIGAEVAAPVDPGAHELAVVEILVEDHVRHREEQRAFGARVRRQPQVRLRRRVRQARVDHDERRAVRLAFDDPLRVRIEVVPGLEVRREQQDRLARSRNRATADRRRTRESARAAPTTSRRWCGCCGRRGPTPAARGSRSRPRRDGRRDT